MFYALLSTILWSFANVFWKKCTAFKVRPFANSISSLPIPIVILMYFIVNWYSFNTTHIISIVVILIIVLLDLIKDPINQQIYKEEKISLLVPYQNINKIFVIITSFFIFNDVSYITLFITLFTIWVIIISSFDFKNKKLPRNFSKILFVETILTLAILLWWWVVLKYWEVNYFIIYVIIWTLLYLVIAFKTKHIYDLKNVNKVYWFNRLIAWFWWISWFISLLLIKSLWLSISILLGFIWIWITLLISFFFLWDTPSRKNIWLTIVVSILIWIGFYFK